jgi:hypothetical protein
MLRLVHRRPRLGPALADTLVPLLPELDVHHVLRWYAARVHEHPHGEPRLRVAELLEELERDPTAVFWG